MLGAPHRLRCEYLSNPLGIDATRPRLSWWAVDDRPAEIQTGYHLLAATSADLLAVDHGDLWDTDKVESQQTLNIEYRGRPLSSGQRVWWKIRSYDSDGLSSNWSEPAFFELGLLATEDWRARWIGAPLRGSPATPVQVPALRRSFELHDDVVAARLHITALGIYQVELNGQRASDDRFNPGWTDYRQRVRYQTYDVTSLLHKGANAVGVLLADGWYSGSPGIGPRQQYGERPLLCAQINVTLASGASLLICTDHQWKWQRSWLLYSDLVQGESVDGRQYLAGWSEPQFIEQGWYPVIVEEAPQLQRSATMCPPIQTLNELTPIGSPLRVPAHRDEPLAASRWVYDFGHVLVGWVRVGLAVGPGMALRVRYSQAIEADGELKAPVDAGVDWYTTSGAAEGETYEPNFSLHGFRYVELEVDVPQATEFEVVAIVAGTNLDATGTFHCDRGLLNDLFAFIRRSLQMRALNVPIAGIGSNRRVALTGETRGLLNVAGFNYDVSAFYAKWLDDLSDAQLAQGGFPPIVPTPPGVARLHRDGGAGWSDVFVSCAWSEYRQFGNRQVLERHYSSLSRFVRGLMERWPDRVCEPEPNPLMATGNTFATDLSATALFFQTARLAARIAGVLGNLSDHEDFEELAQSIRSAFRKRFVTPDGRMVGDSDAAYVLALHLGLLDRAERLAAFDTLVERIELRGAQSVDLLATPYLLQVLTRGGRVDLAYEMLLQPGRSGGLERALGGPEAYWDEAEAELARAAVGSIGEWLYTGLAGIDLDSDLSDSHNAFRRVRIQPRPPLGTDIAVNAFGPPVRSVDAGLDTVNGRFECSWKITESAFELQVLVPCNCSAVVVMPDDTEYQVAAGYHEFLMPLLDAHDGIPILREVSLREVLGAS
jgi:alpha-L-rhamnosidase